MTCSPCEARRRTNCEPMKPAPPVTRTRMRRSVAGLPLTSSRGFPWTSRSADRARIETNEACAQPLAPVRQLGGALLAPEDRVRRPRRARAELCRRDAADARGETGLLEDRLREVGPGAVAARSDVIGAVGKRHHLLRRLGEVAHVG